eukprot:4533008-Ditylum_brightwellii.AAC.1
MSNLGEEFESDSSKVSNCDSLNVSQSNCHVKPEGEENMTEKGGDNAVSEVHKKTAEKLPILVKNLEVTVQKYQIVTV